MSVTQEITQSVGAPAYDPRADQTADLRSLDDVVAAAAKARETALADETSGADARRTDARRNSRDIHDLEGAALFSVRYGVRAPALWRLIGEAVALKDEAFRLGQLHTIADEARFDARAGEEEEVAEANEANAFAAWNAARDRLQQKADEILVAPFDGPDDLLARAHAYSILIAPSDQDDAEPAGEDDVRAAYQSLRSGIQEMADAHKGTEAFEMAARAYLKHAEAVCTISAELDDKGGRVTFDEGIVEEIGRRLQKQIVERDGFANDVLAERPATASQLALQINIIAAAVTGASTTHASRDRLLAHMPLTVDQIKTDIDVIHRIFALLLENAERLAQRDLSRGWRDLMAEDWGLVKMHPNTRDVLSLAASKGIDPERFGGIHLVGDDDSHLPQIIFTTDEGHAIAKPGVVYDWRAVK